MAAQKEGLLQGIYGRLGDLGKIADKYDCAITTSTALLDAIVVETVDDGTHAM